MFGPMRKLYLFILSLFSFADKSTGPTSKSQNVCVFMSTLLVTAPGIFIWGTQDAHGVWRLEDGSSPVGYRDEASAMGLGTKSPRS